MTSAHPEISPNPPTPPDQPAVCIVTVDCKSPATSSTPAYNFTITSPNRADDWFQPWTISLLPPFPTTITLIVTGSVTRGQTETKLPISVSMEVSGNGYMDAPTPVAAINLNASRSGDGMTQAIMEINLADYGATPTNDFWIQATINASAEAQGATGAQLTTGLTTGPSLG